MNPLVEEQNNFLILGKKRSAKTSLGYKILEDHNKKKYVYRHPNPKALKKLPFKVENIVSFDELLNLKEAAVLIDEAHIHFSALDKTVNENLRNMLGISGQNNLSIIFVTHTSYFINRSLFNYIDVRIIKQVNPSHWELERPHMKKLYQHVSIFGNENYYLDSEDIHGKFTFDKPKWFSDELSKAYADTGARRLF